MAPLFKSFSCFSVFPSGLRIVPPITRKHYATVWHITKLRSQDSCGFAGFTSIEFCGRNRRKPLMLQGFPNVPQNDTLRRNFFAAFFVLPNGFTASCQPLNCSSKKVPLLLYRNIEGEKTTFIFRNWQKRKAACRAPAKGQVGCCRLKTELFRKNR